MRLSESEPGAATIHVSGILISKCFQITLYCNDFPTKNVRWGVIFLKVDLSFWMNPSHTQQTLTHLNLIPVCHHISHILSHDMSPNYVFMTYNWLHNQIDWSREQTVIRGLCVYIHPCLRPWSESESWLFWWDFNGLFVCLVELISSWYNLLKYR